MSEARPFGNTQHLLGEADHLWSSLSAQDWLEAFRAHPNIGEQKAAARQSEQTQAWSAQEQSSVHEAATSTKAALAQGNRQYERQFGFIFIICATGKTAAEMLSILNRRLQNSPETELEVAADEQRKITRLRLEKLLNE